MAYIVQPVNNKFFNTSIAAGVDVRFTGNGSFKILRTSYDLTIAQLKNLLFTRKGERYGHPLYGTNLLDILFQPSDDNIKQLITETIEEPISIYIPEITLDGIDIVTNHDDPSLIHQILITINFSVNGEAAMVSVGLSDTGLIIIQGS
jgi:phage baseplate assembly protein W